MSQVTKPRQIITLIVCGRKLKGQKIGRFATLPIKICERLGIEPGDMLEIEVKKISKP